MFHFMFSYRRSSRDAAISAAICLLPRRNLQWIAFRAFQLSSFMLRELVVNLLAMFKFLKWNSSWNLHSNIVKLFMNLCTRDNIIWHNGLMLEHGALLLRGNTFVKRFNGVLVVYMEAKYWNGLLQFGWYQLLQLNKPKASKSLCRNFHFISMLIDFLTFQLEWLFLQ